MWFLLKRLLLLAVIAVVAYCLWPRESSLRTFQPAQIATLETDAAKAGVTKAFVAMAIANYHIFEGQYKVPPLTAVRMAFDYSRATSVFRSAPDASDQEKALPWLESYFESLKSKTKATFDPVTAAKLQLQEWTLRGDRERLPELAAATSERLAFLYGLTAAECLPTAKKFAQAAQQAHENQWPQSANTLVEAYTSLKSLVKPKAVPAS